MRRPPLRFVSRADAVRQLRAQLERGSWPRAQMLLLVLLTAASGFVASSALLVLGVEAMWLRYGLACCVAYACFLLLLWIWMQWRKGESFDGEPDFPDAPAPAQGGDWHGEGGSSGGGGASARFDAPASPATAGMRPEAGAPLPASPAPGSHSDGGIDFDLDIDAVPVLLLLLVAGLVLSSLFVVWTAPALFAELLLDGVLVAGLYRRLRNIETRHWLETALRKTAWPFVLTTLVLAATGFALQRALPHADTLGDVLAQPDRSGD